MSYALKLQDREAYYAGTSNESDFDIADPRMVECEAAATTFSDRAAAEKFCKAANNKWPSLRLTVRWFGAGLKKV